MRDLNAKAPKSRKNEISPLMGSIIKISALLVVAALVVLITLIIIQSASKEEDKKPLFSDRIIVNLSDYKILTRQEGTFDDISSDKIDDIIDGLVLDGTHETTNFYFFFYYQSRIDNLDEELKELVDSDEIAEDATIFIAPIDATESGPSELYSYLYDQDELQALDIRDALEPSFNSLLLVYNFSASDEYQLFSTVSGQKTQLNDLVN